MIMKIEHKLDQKVSCNFCIHHIYRKHHFHHETNGINKSVHAVQTARVQL